MIDILRCKLVSQKGEVPTFSIKGTHDGVLFKCRVEIDDDDVDYEHLGGVNLGPDGLDVLDELVDEIVETEEYLDAVEDD